MVTVMSAIHSSDQCRAHRCAGYKVMVRRLGVLLLALTLVSSEELGNGHNQPFGFGRPSRTIDEIDGFPDSEAFFKNYVFASKPLKMTNAAKISPAFHLWSDDYLMSVDIPSDMDSQVTVETRKKENRTANVIALDFKDFLKTYNNSDIYMVHEVPKYIRGDVVMPCPLQCEDMVNDDLVETMMWFSSGGTKSVVHTDSVENINCLYRGEKQFVMVDPHKYKDYVDLDHPEGSYSGIDVDRVDYTKYPGLAKVEYYHVNMTAGDCLFIPYLWIHQVRSWGSNLAVNLWWDHYKCLHINLSKCNAQCNTAMTLDSVVFRGFSGETEAATVKDHLSSIVRARESVDPLTLMQLLLGERFQQEHLQEREVFEDFLTMFVGMVAVIDTNKDGKINKEEVDSASDEMWMEVKDRVLELGDMEAEIMESQEDPPEEEEAKVAEGWDSLENTGHRDEL